MTEVNEYVVTFSLGASRTQTYNSAEIHTYPNTHSYLSRGVAVDDDSQYEDSHGAMLSLEHMNTL